MGEAKLKREAAYFWCSHLQMVTPWKVRALLEECRDPEGVFAVDRNRLQQEFRFTKREVAILERAAQQRDVMEERYGRMEEQGIRYLSVESEEYPARLKEVADRPTGLFVRGKLPSDDKPCVAIVGARACSEYGRQCAVELAGTLADAGVQVISGMAYGIDGIAQRAALAVGYSCGVLAGSVDICYPKENYDLYEGLVRSGGVVSEMLPGTRGIPILFPRRNRIISGMSDAVVVVEAREKSGSLITADCAAEQGRHVYAVPGSVNSALSRGCHELIRAGATLLQSPDELLRDLKLYAAAQQTSRRKNVGTERLDGAETAVYRSVPAEPVDLERLLSDTGYPVGDLSAVLLRLELKGYVFRLPGNQFQRTRLSPPRPVTGENKRKKSSADCSGKKKESVKY